jgi:hypothetical protein
MMASSWQVVGAAVPGTSHRKMGLPCQDAQTTRLLSNGTVLVALADGAGTAERSQEGARQAVDRALICLEAALTLATPQDDAGWEVLIRDAFQQARQGVLQIAEENGISLKAFATTLICAVVSDCWSSVGQIGDGAVVAADMQDDYFTFIQPQRGEYANETNFLTMENASDLLAVRVLSRPVRALAVMSDGLTRLALKIPGYDPHIPFFKPLFAFATEIEGQDQAVVQLEAFLNSERVNNRTDDDKALVLAARAPGPGSTI